MYRGSYNWEEILKEFCEDPDKIEEPEELIFAEYNDEGYDGYADVLFYDSGKFWYVTASHCSCYGLEDSWSPEEYSIEALKGQVERANYGFFKDHKKLILDACERYSSDISQLAAKLSQAESRQKKIKVRLSELDAEHLTLTSECDELGKEITDAKDLMRKKLN